MSKRELKSLLSRLLPYIYGKKQTTALFTVVLLLGLSHGAFDAPHVHVEPAPIEPTVAVGIFSSGNTATVSATGTLVADVPMTPRRWDI